MAISRVIEVSFRGSSVALVRIDTAYFYNNGILFKPTDLDLPASYQVHWADSPQASTTLETIGTAEGAPIPDDLWNRSRVIYGWIYLHPTEDSGVTGYEVRIYKNVRAGMPDGTEPTPAEQSTIDQAISALNTAVAKTAQDVVSADQSARSASDDADRAERARTRAETAQGKAEDAQESAERAKDDAETSERNASESERKAKGYADTASEKADAITGLTATATTLPDGSSATANYNPETGVMSFGIPKGKDGTNGTDGIDGISPSVSVTDITGGHRVVITDKDGTKSFDVVDGATGATPNLTIGTVETLEPTESATATITGTPENPVLNLGIPQGDAGEVTLDEFYKAFPTDTASGAIASFSDGADDLPLKSLIVDINPTQDLHGQENPYPAGGGKNLLYVPNPETVTINGVTWTLNQNGSITVNGTATGASTYRYISQETGEEFNGDYFFQCFPTISIDDFHGGVQVSGVWFSIHGDRTTRFSGISGKIQQMWFQVKTGHTLNTTFYPMIYKASEPTPTAWSPYENICPISGWTEVNVNHSDADMTNPTTLTIQLGQTVYGAKLYPLEGKAVIDMAMVDLGTLEWQRMTDRTYAVFRPTSVITNMKHYPSGTGNPNMICSRYPCIITTFYNDFGDANNDNKLTYIRSGGQSNKIAVQDSAYTDEASFTVAMNGVQLCYELAEPLEIQLTPNQVNSLYGVNNIWADSGDTEVEYRADTKLFIERLTAPDSADMVADANITSGQYFMVGNNLFKATSNIANGSAIIVGTNCIRKSLSEALNEINA